MCVVQANATLAFWMWWTAWKVPALFQVLFAIPCFPSSFAFEFYVVRGLCTILCGRVTVIPCVFSAGRMVDLPNPNGNRSFTLSANT